MSELRTPLQTPVDAAQRAAALDPTQSFCVTAPAGSGKTELLSQRVLCLLARAQQPEEILAITFTRKAAAEMRARIFNALLAAQLPEPEESHRRQTWQLARAVLQRDAECAWNLLRNPARLRVQTIDGLCSSLIAQMPVLSRFGGLPRIVEQAQPLYVEAVNALLAQLEQPGAIAASIAELLLHLDNQVERLQTLLAGLLARRDQWLPHIGSGITEDSVRAHLEATLRQVRSDALQRVRENVLPYAGELLALLDFAATRMAQLQPDAPLVQFRGCTDLPGVETNDVAQWKILADWLLTKEGTWRSTVDKRQGFPVGDDKEQKAQFKERKQCMLALLDHLKQDEALREQLAEIRYLPAAHYDAKQWQVLVHLTRLLAQAVAQLDVVFQSRGEVDFTEMSLSALRALGSELAPSDLMLRLDARIRHLLIDEFQDTSTTQFRLLERLVEGWREHNESGAELQTLFVVGDGMQSIYGFREAKVGLFLEARAHGVNHLLLRDSPLTVNFRSTPTIVDWVNRTFAQAFPQSEHIARGAVPYEASSAFNADRAGSEVKIYGTRNDADRNAEAERCVQLAQQALAADEKGNVAILVRYRTHLRAIVPALQRAGICWRATDIDPLAQRANIQDLLSLLKALLNPADRIAWLALLRSPLLGFDNADLHCIAAGADGGGLQRTLLSRLRDRQVLTQLSAQAVAILKRTLPIIELALAQRARKSLRSWLEGVWIALGGHLLLASDADWRDVQVLLDLVEELAPHFDIAQLEERLLSLYARADTAAPTAEQVQDQVRVLLMTIHKSKGLEFDTVIVPGLDAGTRQDDKPLLRWNEYLSDDGDTGLVLSVKSALGGDEDATYAWLHYEHKQKQALEDTRLLYVAATRAISKLYLLFASKKDENEFKNPSSNCLLARIWPAVKDEVQWIDNASIATAFDDEAQDELLHRVPANWPAPVVPAIAELGENPLTLRDSNESLEASIGSVIHQLLEHIARFGSEPWLQRSPQRKQSLLEPLLLQAGVRSEQIPAAIDIIVNAIDTMLGDERGRWLLSASHNESVTEWELLTAEGQRYVIDRSFVERNVEASVDKNGVRWIVDYKSSVPRADETRAQFLQREALAHLPQLQNYRALVAAFDARPIKLALYFPRIPHWLELE